MAFTSGHLLRWLSFLWSHQRIVVQVRSLQSGVHWHKGTGLGVQKTSHFYTGGKKMNNVKKQLNGKGLAFTLCNSQSRLQK